MKSGEEIKLELEWNFTNDAHDQDWSITAYGDQKGDNLHIEHFQGLKSDSMPFIPRNVEKPEPEIPSESPVVPESIVDDKIDEVEVPCPECKKCPEPEAASVIS